MKGTKRPYKKRGCIRKCDGAKESMDKKELMYEQKAESLEKNSKTLLLHFNHYQSNHEKNCDLFKEEVRVKFCETKQEKALWKAYTHLTTSLPLRSSVGRRVEFFVTCEEVVLGMVSLSSPMAQLKLRDQHLNWDKECKWKELNRVYNISVCVPTRKYANFLTGKLLVYLAFSNQVYEYLENKYQEEVLGFETTSLYGKSSQYNRIPFLKYLGTTEGYSAVCISDKDWKKVFKEYKEVFPNTKTNRMAPVKFQIIDKLQNHYKKLNLPFPHKYKSVEYQRGVYFGYKEEKETKERVQEWRERWLSKRKERRVKELDLCAAIQEWKEKNSLFEVRRI